MSRPHMFNDDQVDRELNLHAAADIAYGMEIYGGVYRLTRVIRVVLDPKDIQATWLLESM